MSEHLVDISFLMPECGITEEEEKIRICSAAVILLTHASEKPGIRGLMMESINDGTLTEMVTALLRLQERGLIRVEGTDLVHTNRTADAAHQILAIMDSVLNPEVKFNS